MNTERIEQAIECAIFDLIKKGDMFKIEYGNRIDLSTELAKTYRKINYERIYSKMTELLEEEIARKLVNKVITEMGTDIKKMMSNPTVRDDLRFFMRQGVQRVLDKAKQPESIRNELAEIRAEKEQLKAKMDHMERKHNHGCTDAYCKICDQ